MAFVNRTPRAISSRRTVGIAYKESNRWSSVRIKTTFGRSAAAWASGWATVIVAADAQVEAKKIVAAAQPNRSRCVCGRSFL